MLGLSNDTLAVLLFGGVMGFFLVRLIRQLDKLSDNVANLNVTMVRLETDNANKNTVLQTTLAEHHDRVEAVSKRVHWMVNKMTELKLKLEMQGMAFEKDSWRLPD